MIYLLQETALETSFWSAKKKWKKGDEDASAAADIFDGHVGNWTIA